MIIPGVESGRVPVSAKGVLADFAAAELIGLADVHLAQLLGRLAGERDEDVLLAVALTVRALQNGSVC